MSEPTSDNPWQTDPYLDLLIVEALHLTKVPDPEERLSNFWRQIRDREHLGSRDFLTDTVTEIFELNAQFFRTRMRRLFNEQRKIDL